MKIIKHAMTALSLKDEIKLVFKNKYEFIDVFDFNTMFSEHSELSQGKYTKIQSVKNFLTPLKISNNGLKEPIIREGNKEANVIYVNGICSSKEMAQYQRETLSLLLRKDVELLYNQTDGFLLDIAECVQDRLEHDISKAAIEVSKIIIEKLLKSDPKEDVIVIGYSQGTIITTKAIHIINKKLPIELKKRLKLITFATACKLYQSEDIESEHFVNLKDPVCKLGYLEYQNKISGELFYQNKKGHLLVADYLTHIEHFESVKESMFCKLITENTY